MKINWNRIWNPNNIDFKKLNKMSREEANDFLKETIKGDLAKMWIRFTFLFNYLVTTNTWQYVLVLWIK